MTGRVFQAEGMEQQVPKPLGVVSKEASVAGAEEGGRRVDGR